MTKRRREILNIITNDDFKSSVFQTHTQVVNTHFYPFPVKTMKLFWNHSYPPANKHFRFIKLEQQGLGRDGLKKDNFYAQGHLNMTVVYYLTNECGSTVDDHRSNIPFIAATTYKTIPQLHHLE